jgi:hypothetical protein
MDKPMVMLLLKKVMEDSKPDMEKSESGYGDSIGYNEGKHAAAKEIIEAIRSSNIGAFTTALESFISMCEYEKE